MGGRQRLGRRRTSWAYAVGTVGSLAMAAVLALVPRTALPIQTLLMLTVVIGSALIGGLGPAIVAALVSALTLNLAFVAPTGSLSIADPVASVTLLVFVVIGLAVAAVVDRSARLAEQARRARDEADALAELARRLLAAATDPTAVLAELCRTLEVPGAAIWRVASDQTDVEAVAGAPPVPGAAAAWTVIEDDVHLVLAASPPTDRLALLTAYAAHLRVIRERSRAEERARQAAELAEGNRIRSALLAAVSHDLRSPLAAIKAAVSSLRSDEVTWSGAEEAELLATIDDGADRMARLIANLLDLTRLQSGALGVLLDEVDLLPLVEAVIADLERPDRIRIELPPHLLVRADPGLTERVLANLIDNAVSYAGDSAILITAAPGEAGAAAVRVVDHGPGVAPAGQGRLFQPFQRLGDAPEGSGLGLGLAVARGLTEAMGGELVAEDTPGGGLTLVLSLPLADSADDAVADPPHDPEVRP